MNTFRQKRKENRFMMPILSIFVVILVFLVGFVLGRAGFNVAFEKGDVDYTFTGRFYPEEEELDFDLFWHVWNLLEENYVDKNINDKDRYYGAIKGSVAALGDPATLFLTPEETAEYKRRNSGLFQGIGILMGYYDNEVVVKRVFENTPAEASELEIGDVFRKVDGEDVSELPTTDVANKILGEKGTSVSLLMYRPSEDKEFTVDIVRDEIYVKSAWWEELDDGIILITLVRFTEEDFDVFASNWDSLAAEVAAENPRGVILDLRANGGGFLNGATYVAGDFIEEGSVVMYVENREEQKQVKKVQKSGALLDVPLAILVDGDTASASEIFAGALQYYERAIIIGEETFGKGTAQTVIPLNDWDGASIHITTEKWLLPNEEWINHDNPIIPDIEISLSTEEVKNGDDPQLERAQEELMQ